MKITRNGQEFELTQFELAEAYREVQHNIDVYMADIELTLNCPREYYSAFPEKEMKSIAEDLAIQMRDLVREKHIHEEEAIKQVVEKYIAEKVAEFISTEVIKGKEWIKYDCR
jgi:hypothetical protein